ncbi:MAG: hypothetical protein A2140_01830 [Candidatus Muproteobacteria bacterium RBG_16_62_13]|uniref:NAD glycohydrolase translocation F5/8 type C domain-containing protein n=1 Tax=Candidatus Muproteobacteria bacterium RBG_16_62_13 TaxID=1817756 RepID=A0A1F6SX45_9PROT|nr:MAG: hypothetical protein A2140_01830 [Candidatus Muproteobacteria bacterium RBG_16_62_13]
MLYGVPITWEEKRPARDIARDIQLTFNGKKLYCNITDIRPSGQAERKRQGHFEGWGRAWCVTQLSMPGGQTSRLRLQYKAELEYVDMRTTKSALTSFDTRTLQYALWPAAFWKGSVDQFRVEVDFGPYAGFLREHNLPTPVVVDKNRLTYSAKNLDLNSFREIKLDFSAEQMLSHRELVTWNRNADKESRLPISVRASGFLPPQDGHGFNPQNVADGNPKTAWCVSNANGGRGEWLEIKALRSLAKDAQQPGRIACKLQGMVLVPGFSYSQSIYMANNRIRKFRVARCGDLSKYRDIEITHHGKQFDMSALWLSLGIDDLPWWVESAGFRYKITASSPVVEGKHTPTDCWRLTILEVDRGEKYRDTCVSEAALVVNCP